MLRKVISGGQTGADIAGLEVAKKFGLETGGMMPFGFKTNTGCRPKYKLEYGVTIHKSSSYIPRTRANVRDSDGTIRLAFDFDSAGELCTLKAIKVYEKPHIDVNLADPRPVSEVAAWLEENGIEVLNVAGNAEQTSVGTHEATTQYLEELIEHIGD